MHSRAAMQYIFLADSLLHDIPHSYATKYTLHYVYSSPVLLYLYYITRAARVSTRACLGYGMARQMPPVHHQSAVRGGRSGLRAIAYLSMREQPLLFLRRQLISAAAAAAAPPAPPRLRPLRARRRRETAAHPFSRNVLPLAAANSAIVFGEKPLPSLRADGTNVTLQHEWLSLVPAAPPTRLPV